MNITVACVLWQGEFRGRNYAPFWVEKLKRMVERHLPEHDFICLSNVPVECDRIPLVSDLRGWWAKLELFRKDLGISGRILYLDLDVLVVGDLLPIVEFEEEIAFMPPSFEIEGTFPMGGKGIVDRVQSSCMVFDAGEGTEIYTKALETNLMNYRGDQDWIGAVQPYAKTLPKEWFKKLKYCVDGPPSRVKVVLSMPWKNDVAAQMFPWVREQWN